MKNKKDPRDTVYSIDGVNYVGSYDSEGNYHPPCRPPKNGCSCESKDQTRTTLWRGGRMRISDDAGYEVEKPDENNNKGKEV